MPRSPPGAPAVLLWGAYDVTALATSSLPGFIQTLKDHITKPTAMAQGCVAHLMEWKGWRAPPTEEMLYEELTDQLKEARFLSGPSPGVAEQFAIMEATLSGWPSLNEEELSSRAGSQEVIQLQASGPLRSPTRSPPIPSRPLEAEQGGLGRAEGELVGPPSSCRWQQRATSLHDVDNSSSSEDEVFYD
ncbi:LOW QUALITY PROTEIN: protein FAM131C [Protobothrops mucrosquamatus]|uniref:LOW QUALITY PROTEIN: protein FAM131C n=1 Tax=Protobothrops mucrosquamatus TaxID=103944 RepID=UPI0010FB633D|nr:LOW QUALITY PROTEIN: protein FAM131C [Protobothrops mucrosquamatus]